MRHVVGGDTGSARTRRRFEAVGGCPSRPTNRPYASGGSDRSNSNRRCHGPDTGFGCILRGVDRI